mmetsp:Transcript_48384/g.121805  ORF Transcript_48384/g.121805 Transcript_48384/m.121805 type:complete len:182 (-) Transcript_48384:133-678(-)|eukprot:CAMPEP_0177651944 /NCGR_PEP_ID=MMETSP0447-20121125/12837_1 /TAXON_ID=0 /ORGANISM="Stygamoeba regulata, Strain BSH-02190019" /LENGTH=181 /DNA_ID=CAMNT_0019155097 /DNA_START=47 /DNA_END=592 /DNA_ORIENTATION=-
MPKNKGKGGKSKRKGKNKNEDEQKRELVFKEDGQEYGQVLQVLGNCRVKAFCFDGVARLCHVRGKFRKKVWINRDDIILVGLRDYQDGKADVIHKYTADEARKLKQLGELPEKAKINESVVVDGNEDDEDALIDFDTDAIYDNNNNDSDEEDSYGIGKELSEEGSDDDEDENLDDVTLDDL